MILYYILFINILLLSLYKTKQNNPKQPHTFLSTAITLFEDKSSSHQSFSCISH